MIFQQAQQISTPGRGLVNITSVISQYVETAKITTGVCHLFLHHTSASLVICENADDDVQRDMEAFMSRLVPDGDKLFQHIAEGPDDMPAHVRTILTQSALSLPIAHGKLDLGVWQGIYLWEHRLRPYTRKLTITLQG